MFPIDDKKIMAMEIGEAILEAHKRLPDGWSLDVSIETLKSGTVIGTSLNHEEVYSGNIEYDRYELNDVAESIHRLIEIAELGFESCWQK